MLKNNSCSECEKKVITRRVWSNKFASNRGKDALSTQRETPHGEQTPLWETLQTTIFIPVVARQSWGCRDSHAVALIQPFFLFWLRCPLMMANFISLLIKRTFLQPDVPSDTGWEMVSSGMKLRETQTDLRSSDLGCLWRVPCPTVCHSVLWCHAGCHSAVDSASAETQSMFSF